ncbi:MAG: GGDEF domain-containing protein [Thermoanaerobaculia bacterium]
MVRRTCVLAAALLWAVLLPDPAAGQEPGALRVERLPASLAGTWEFALGDPPGGVADLDVLPFRPIAVPGTWQSAGFPGHGTGWYRVTIDLDPSLSIVPLAFACTQIRDVDEVYLDGQPIGRTGGFPPSYDKGTVVERIYELPPSRSAVPGRHVLAVRVHNAGPRGGGITGTPRLDAVSAALHGRMMREAPRALLAAAFAALGLFSLFFFLRDRGQTDFLFFFLTTSVTAVFIVSWLSVWAVFGLPLTFLFRIGHAGVFVLPALAWVLFLKFFERPIGRLHRVLMAAQAVGAVACLFWPRPDDIYYTFPLGGLLGAAAAGDVLAHLGTAARRRVRHARPLFVAAFVAVLAAAFDSAGLLALGVGASIDIALSGPAFFVLMSVLLAALADRLARLRLAASTDPLTSLANRAVLFDRIGLEIARARRNARPVALAILDLDGFKGFNDRNGHVAGDRLLVAAAAAITDSIRDTDLAARFGGDEFVVLLPEADAARAVSCLERIRSGIGRARIAGTRDGSTVSAGVAVFDPNVRASVSVSAWVRQADAALYAAKAAGRDRVLVAHGAPPGAVSGERVPSDDASIRRVPGSSP